MSDLTRAKELLSQGGYTLALVKGEQTHTSTDRGVKPLLMLIGQNQNVQDFSAADLVVGKAAALLYVLLGVKAVYAKVISTLAEEVLLRHGIAVEAQTHVERILSFAGGYCPMETAVEHIEDPAEALAAIRAKIAQMNK